MFRKLFKITRKIYILFSLFSLTLRWAYINQSETITFLTHSRHNWRGWYNHLKNICWQSAFPTVRLLASCRKYLINKQFQFFEKFILNESHLPPTTSACRFQQTAKICNLYSNPFRIYYFLDRQLTCVLTPLTRLHGNRSTAAFLSAREKLLLIVHWKHRLSFLYVFIIAWI